MCKISMEIRLEIIIRKEESPGGGY